MGIGRCFSEWAVLAGPYLLAGLPPSANGLHDLVGVAQPCTTSAGRKAGRALDVYQGPWKGEPLGPDDYVISADEKTSIQARGRIAQGTAPAPRRAGRVEFEYKRGGPLAYGTRSSRDGPGVS